MNRPEYRAYLELDKAAITLEGAGHTSVVDEIHNTMDLIWKLLTPAERATVNARVTVDPNSTRIGGTIHDAIQWEAFADEVKAQIGEPRNPWPVIEQAARRIAARIRGEK